MTRVYLFGQLIGGHLSGHAGLTGSVWFCKCLEGGTQHAAAGPPGYRHTIRDNQRCRLIARRSVLLPRLQIERCHAAAARFSTWCRSWWYSLPVPTALTVRVGAVFEHVVARMPGCVPPRAEHSHTLSHTPHQVAQRIYCALRSEA